MVTANNPNLKPTADPQGPDYLAGAVLHALARPAYPRLSWSPVKTFCGGIVSFGVLPILVWTKRFRQFVTVEQQQLWHLAEWLRCNTDNSEANDLRKDAENIRFHADLRLVATLCLAFLGIIFFTQLHMYRFERWNALLDCTYLYPFSQSRARGFRVVPMSLAFKLFNTWTLALGGAYACHWLQVQAHARSVREFITRFNRIACAEGLTPVKVAMPGAGLRPIWLVGAIALAVTGNLWGVPMMFAGAAQRRLVRYTSTINRAAIAHRLRAMLLSRRPNENVPLPIYLRRLCENPQCRAAVPESACFCPRCGSRIVPALHQVA